MIRKIVYKLVSVLGFGPLFLLRSDGSALLADGWFRSVKEGMPISKNGEPIPWMTYSFITYVESCLNKNMSIFEYGCGNSTLWWAKRVKKVVACEHNAGWVAEIEKVIPTNVSLNFVPLNIDGKYSGFINNYENEFDIIVIDGRERINCAVNSLDALTEKGIIIWDNSERSEYIDGYNFLYENGFRRLDFCGMGPINSYNWCTSIFYRTDNIFNI